MSLGLRHERKSKLWIGNWCGLTLAVHIMLCGGCKGGSEQRHVVALNRTLLKGRPMARRLACASKVSPAVVWMAPVIVIATLC